MISHTSRETCVSRSLALPCSTDQRATSKGAGAWRGKGSEPDSTGPPSENEYENSKDTCPLVAASGVSVVMERLPLSNRILYAGIISAPGSKTVAASADHAGVPCERKLAQPQASRQAEDRQLHPDFSDDLAAGAGRSP